MVDRGRGRILFTSSIASTMPGSFQAVYNASKSFVQSFALAIRNELKDTGVTVTSLMPGPTDTEFFERAAMMDTKLGQADKDDPADVARDGFEALMKGEERAVSHSLMTKAQALGSRLMPDSVKSELHRKQAEPGSASSQSEHRLPGGHHSRPRGPGRLGRRVQFTRSGAGVGARSTTTACRLGGRRKRS